jgi:hypothetical protein
VALTESVPPAAAPPPESSTAKLKANAAPPEPKRSALSQTVVPATPTPQQRPAPTPPPAPQPPAKDEAQPLAKTAESEREETPAEPTAARGAAAQATYELDRKRMLQRAAEATAALDRENAARRAAERDRQLAAERAAAEERAQATARPVAAPARPAVDERTGITSRIGLDEAARQLGGPLHAIDGLSRQTLGLVSGASVEGADPDRPVVRAVYVDRATGTTLFLDQQMARPGAGPAAPRTGAGGRQIWVKDGVLLVLHGGVGADSLRSLARRVR